MRRREANRIIRVKHHTVTALLWQAVFGKEDLLHTLYPRATPSPGRSGVDTNVVRSKA